MPARQLYIAAYDISDAGRLRLALKLAKEFTTGGQKSVFECFLTAAERAELLRRMAELIDTTTDRFALLRVQPRTQPETLGIAVAPGDPDWYYVG